MTDEQDRTTAGPLTSLQRARVDFATQDLEDVRTEDLAQLPGADLILLVERMRGRLDDMLKLIDEITEPPHGQ
ncbi:hypothetical protein SAURM35S_07677 [Streptomyces aurantiogriseus]